MDKKLLLINLGGPRNTEEIEKFLLDLFGDPFLFDLPLPEFLRLRLGRFIAQKRAPKVAESYKMMGLNGGSPIVNETQKQADALKESLELSTKSKWNVQITMTCGYPNIRDLPKEDLIPSKDNIILPLYPHFSRSTTLSTANIIQTLTGQNPIGKTGWIPPFYKYSSFLNASVNIILDYCTGKLITDFISLDKPKDQEIDEWKKIPILFSAHGIPMRLVKKGDTYPTEIQDHLQKIEYLLRKRGYEGKTYLSFQSRVGPTKWTSPSTINMIRKLGSDGVKRLMVYPISFVSDHLETIVEIGEELKHEAKESGIQDYYRIPALGVYPPFIKAITELVELTL